MKDFIKQLSAQQKELKKARKTGKYEVQRSEYGWAILPDNVKNANKAANDARRNAITITAALNLYHELRGSPYRHNVPSGDYEYWYKKDYEKLREQFKNVGTKT